MVKLTDESKMPFGVHKGSALANVPASYLLWLYNDRRDIMNNFPDLDEYIKDNYEDLKSEAKKK